VITLMCRIVIAVCAEIIHHLTPDEVIEVEEEYGPRIFWGGDAPLKVSDD